MSIQINLLAEAQAQEELRRRDPVKRAIGVGVLLVFVILAWSSSLWLKGMMLKGELNRLEARKASLTNDFQTVEANQKKLKDTQEKLGALRLLAANRYLNGTMLNALQQTMVPNVQLTHLKVEELYKLNEATKPKTNGSRVIPGNPATITENITLSLEGRDFSPIAGDAWAKYKEALSEASYFKDFLRTTNQIQLKDLGTPQTGSTDGKAFVPFTLECRYPEKTR